MAARKNKITLSDEWKEKIRISQIINRLNQGFNGEIELTSEQIRIADMLLKKVVPDLARTTIDGDPNNPVAIMQMPSIKLDDKAVEFDVGKA